MVNVHGGARGRLSGVLAGVFALAVLLALGPYLAWLPVPALAAIVSLMAARMLQREALLLFRERHTLLDFFVVVAVVATAMVLNLAAAAAAGVLVSMLLFLREQVRAPLVRRLALGDQLFSKRRRSPRAREVLARHGGETVVVELQGSLFFGTADRLFRVLEPHLGQARQVILDLAWIRSIDLTAATTLRQIAAQLGERGARLVLCDIPSGVVGRKLGTYFEQLGLDRPPTEVKIVPHLDEALEWAEEESLSREPSAPVAEDPLALAEMELFAGLPAAALGALETEVRERVVRAGERVFGFGEVGESELYLVRDGAVRLLLPLENGKAHALATVGRGEFFGEIGFTDRDARTADAVAAADTSLFALSRGGLAAASAAYPALETELLARLSHALAARLRLADLELRALKEM
jgi:SulP family sulfate permease